MNSTQNHYAQQSPMGPPAPPLHQNVSYSSQNSHQLPQTPQTPTGRPNARPTSKSGFSFRSHKSQNSDGTPKMDLHESPAEKRARRLSTKADPRMAMSEAEPSQLANDHSSSLQPLRNIVHKDMNGNPIVDPDRSNPTRSRWERPLDTIRAFEAAIDGNYARKSGSRPDADSRRTSYAGSQVGPMRPQGNGYSSYNSGYNNGYGGGRNGGGSNVGSNYEGYDNYNGRTGGGYQSRPDSYYSNNDNNNGYHPNRQRFPRQGSEPAMNGGYSNGGYGSGYGNGYNRNEPSPPRDGYPQRGQQQMSYETVTTASGSGSSSDRMNYSTDPSSENSSFDQGGYNPTSYSQQQQYGPSNSNGYSTQQQQQQYGQEYQDQVRPLPPAKNNGVPVRLGKPDPRLQQQQQQQQAGGGGLDQYGVPASKQEKKKSWLGRTFSKRK